jgi:hypothetical protein
MILGALLLIGCGSDGDTGPPGAKGDTGDTGPAGTSVSAASAETCSICHGAGSIADIAVAHPDDMSFQGDDVLIQNITLVNNAGTAEVTFDLVRSIDNTPITDLDGVPLTADDFRFAMADLVPANTATDPTGNDWGTFGSPYWERWAYERSGGTYPQGALTDNTGGNYTYGFATAFGSATALADAPDLDHTLGASHPQRLFIRFDGQGDATIERGNGRGVGFLDFIVPAVADGATQATVLDPQRQFVTSTACEQCHSPNWERAAGGHTQGRRDIKACVICHSPIGFDQFETDPVEANRGQFMQDNNSYASIFFHRIHGAIAVDLEWSNRIGGRGYGAVTFPQVDADENLRDCVVCHNNDPSFYTGNTEALGTQAALIDNWKEHPTVEICSSCHFPGSGIGMEADLVTGANHGGGVQPNSACTVCHQPDTDSIAPSTFSVHDITPRVAGTNGNLDEGYLPENIREFDVTLSLSPAPANGMNYIAGDVITVTATLADHATSTPVAPSVYTTPQDLAGNVGGGLHEAYVQFSGPRARPLPVLATDTFSDPNWDGDLDTIEDEHEMFVGSTDPQVKTDATGFKYQTLAIPADVKPGTYIVRVVFADYGRAGSGDYRIDSFQWQLIQIGTATVEPKVAGDACVNCHGAYDFATGTGTAPFHDERNSVAFDTYQCLTCHHDSGHAEGERLHGVPLANRVHAVHAANPEGDIYNFSTHNAVQSSRDWSDVTFPRDIMNCNTCHNFGYVPASNTFTGTYKTLPYMMPCSGCHVGMSNDFTNFNSSGVFTGATLDFVPGVVDHMRQNGGPWLPNPNEDSEGNPIP